MAEKKLNTRISLRYDEYSKWVENNPTLNKGEVAIATVPTGDTNNVSTELPAVLIKVGDGVNDYQTLPFLSAKAADVHAYAKKPEAEFIAWIKEIISTEGAYDTKGSAEQALADAKAYTDELANGAVKSNTDAITAIKDGENIDSFADVETELAKKQDVIPENTYDTYGSATQALTDAKSYTDELANGAVKANTDAIDAIKDSENIDSFADVETELAKKQDIIPENTYDTYGSAVSVLGSDSDDSTKNTVYGVKALANENKAAIETLNGTGDGSVSKQVADAIAAVVAEAPEDLDTLKEIADFIAGDGADAAGLANQVNANTNAIDAIKDSETIDSFADVVTELAKKQDTIPANTYDTYGSAAQALTDAKAYTDELANGTVKTNGEEITKIKDGTTVVAKATSDADGNVISETYETKTYVKTQIDGLESILNSVNTVSEEAFSIANINSDVLNTEVVKTIEVTDGLTIERDGTDEEGGNPTAVTIGIDDSVTFIFDCGDASGAALLS